MISALSSGHRQIAADRKSGSAAVDSAAVAFKWIISAGLLLTFIGLGAGFARADQPYPVLTQSAIPARAPDRVVLIDIAKAGSRLVAVGEHGVIIYSDDNGHSWLQSAVPVSISVTCVAFANPMDGWAGADYGVVLHTTDGGVTWKVQITGDQVNQLMTQAAFAFSKAQPTNEIAQRALRRASIFVAAGPDKPFLTIWPWSARHVLVFGSYRMMLVTEDAGEHWSDWSLNVGDPVSHNLYDVAWDGKSLYLVGEMGTVLQSTDRGNSFVLRTAPSDSTLFGVLSLADNVLLAYGVAGALFRSTDEGQSWKQITVPLQSNLTAGTVLATGQIVIVSESGDVLISSDHAVSFRVLPANEGMGLFGVIQAANGNVVFVGSSGVRTAIAGSLN